ncbi:AbgT family transporter [Nocardioides ganghwensis]|jgi:aminobenzoyl-glutamate transport protein|uniref:AbgT family transporter n=1 Tax=Nocardioides ganghwensis TaxID=252230 RepID=A0A4Q2SA54_9ACTN|nr:AbgT family transporter [Nocardioides ganghwensis]MBD3947887.1 AbgT family transporter [Nocardioides ganghwensis]RYB97692.1 AbgT family transporter [Nocardioides ganghwensis]
MTTTATPTSRTDRALAAVERVGNRLPDPFLLFLGLFLLVGVISTALQLAGTSVTIPGAEEETVVRGLFTGEGLAWLTVNLGANFIGFPPLVTVVTILLAVTVAERTGLLSAAIRASLGSAPRWLLPYAVGFVGVNASVMADAAFIVVPPLAAMVFKAAGRHPIAGLVGGFAAVGAGYSTSMLVTSLDALFAGITSSVTGALPQAGAAVTPVSNLWFNMVSSVVLALVAGLVIDRLVEPRLVREGAPVDMVDQEDAGATLESAPAAEDDVAPALRATPTELSPDLEPAERRGLRVAGLVFLVLAAVVVAAVLPGGSPWRNDDGAFLPESPLLDSTVFIVFVLFLGPALAYGFVSGSLREAADVPKVMGLGIKDMAAFIVLAFMLGQFIALFNWTNVGSALAVAGADGLESIGLTGYPAILGFILLASVLNLFIVSGSSMWTLMGAVFVPLFALLGYEPGFVQAAFRVGDSATQVITPMNPYIWIFLVMLKRYEPEAGLGTVISRMIPFVVPFWISWVTVLTVFYLTGADVGPGVGIRI